MLTMKYESLIQHLKTEVSTRTSPGPVLNNIMFRYIDDFSRKYKINSDLIYIGGMLSDIRLDEAIGENRIQDHIEMAVRYFGELIDEYEISKDDSEIIIEIIETHHGGAQKFIESKIFRNADNFKFLEPRGCFHYLGSLYENHTDDELDEVINEVIRKLEEKLKLTDLDDETIELANDLFNKNISILNQMVL